MFSQDSYGIDKNVVLLLDNNCRLDQPPSIAIMATAPGNGHAVSCALHGADALKPCPGEVSGDSSFALEGSRGIYLFLLLAKVRGRSPMARDSNKPL